ncbi:MAG: hypothetical protein U0R17_01990 [Acidimicrobiia bacterium]
MSLKNINKITNRVISNPLKFALSLITIIGVIGCVIAIWQSMQPGLIFSNTTATGGDMGAHVWWPAFMRDFLLPHGRLFGWSMDYYSGFPVGQYYFPIPALMVVIFDLLLPYNVAFKLVTVLGSVTLPIAAYILGKSIKAPKPIPLIMAFMATSFLFFTGDPRGDSATASTIADFKNAAFNQRIMGGPLLSSMAGEFSFSIALTFSLLFLSAFYVMLRDKKYRGRVAVLLALTIMSHLVVAIFTFIAAIVFWGASYASRKGYFRYIGASLLSFIVAFALSISVVGKYFFDNKLQGSTFEYITLTLLVFSLIAIIGLLIFGVIKEKKNFKQFIFDASPLVVGLMVASIWLLPLLARFSYTSNMRYEKLTDLLSTPGVNEVYELYVSPKYFMWPIFIPAAIGFILSATFLRKSILPVIITAATMAIVFIQWPEGHAWNLRFLPFWYLFIFFVAAFGYGEILRLPTSITTWVAYKQKEKSLVLLSQIISLFVTFVLVVGFLVGLVGIGSAPKDKATGCASIPDTRLFNDRRGFADSWAKYNFEGYERKPQDPSCKSKQSKKHLYTSSKEFYSLMDEMKKLKPGRALWEPSDGTYGTTLALMLIPYYTNHRIASQEGLYYEAAGSTAYHFLTVAEVSKTPSNPMRWPKCETKSDGTKVDPKCFDTYYGTLADFNRGIDHMKMMGVRYYLAHSEEAKKAADASSKLKLISSVADRDGLNPVGWDIYQIKNWSLVEPLANDPVVITDKTSPSDWAQSGNKWLYDWFNAPGEYREFVNSGEKNWQRMTAKQALSKPLTLKQKNKKSEVKITNVKLTQDSIKFHVNKIGEPVLIKTSYYPTFKASGAGKIYRASPNSMIVVPTKQNVKIEIARDGIEWFSIFLFLAGVSCVIGFYFDKKKTIAHLSSFLRPKR